MEIKVEDRVAKLADFRGFFTAAPTTRINALEVHCRACRRLYEDVAGRDCGGRPVRAARVPGLPVVGGLPRHLAGGCHISRAIAATRALSEAAQSRLTAIAGTRDDLPSDPASFDVSPFRPARTAGLVPWPHATAHFGRASGAGFAAQVKDVALRIAHVTGHEPVALDLSEGPAPIYAVQVVCLGTRSRIRRAMPR
ncbi:YcaO-like family protein [Streptomyces prasinus]